RSRGRGLLPVGEPAFVCRAKTQVLRGGTFLDQHHGRTRLDIFIHQRLLNVGLRPRLSSPWTEPLEHHDGRKGVTTDALKEISLRRASAKIAFPWRSLTPCEFGRRHHA